MRDVDTQYGHSTGGGAQNGEPAPDKYEPMPDNAWCDFTSAIERAAKNLAEIAQNANIYGRSNPRNQETHIIMMLGSLAALERLRQIRP